MNAVPEADKGRRALLTFLVSYLTKVKIKVTFKSSEMHWYSKGIRVGCSLKWEASQLLFSCSLFQHLKVTWPCFRPACLTLIVQNVFLFSKLEGGKTSMQWCFCNFCTSIFHTHQDITYFAIFKLIKNVILIIVK